MVRIIVINIANLLLFFFKIAKRIERMTEDVLEQPTAIFEIFVVEK